MTGPVWYYAQGDTEKGPLTTAQIKALAAAGKIRGDDFVWKQGMDSWVPAREAADLVLPEAADRVEINTAPTAIQQATRRQPVELASSAWPRLGKSLVAAGLLTLLLVRGCDTLALRNVQRLEAIPAASRQLFDEAWNSQRRRLQLKLQAAGNENGDARADEAALRQQLDELERQNQSQQQQLEAGLWQQQRVAAQHAETDNHIRGYWREIAFLTGSIGLACGLMMIAFATQGPDRWISFGMLGVLIYAAYTAGRGW